MSAALTAPQIGSEAAKFGDFDGHDDVGSPKIAGSAAYNPVSQEYSLAAAGANMWAQHDEFHFVWKRMTGDFILQARVQLLGKGVEAHRKVGLDRARQPGRGAPYVDAIVHGDGLTSLQFRRTKGDSNGRAPVDRSREQTSSSSNAGATLHHVGRQLRRAVHEHRDRGPVLGDDLFVGLALCAHNPDVTERAVLSNVRLSSLRKRFRSVSGLHRQLLEMLDVASGHRQVLHRADQPFEAPNWTRDGRR